ncbi:MAG: hypothetical protein ACYCTB_09345 [bacterium]
MQNKYRIYIDIDGDIAELFKNKKYNMPFGFKRQLAQKLFDDFSVMSSNKKELKSNIIKYLSGEMRLEFKDSADKSDKSKISGLMNLKNIY